MTPDVIHVQACANYELLITFADSKKCSFSMLPYLQYPTYQELKSPNKFMLAHVANGTVAWDNDIDMSPDTLYISGQAASRMTDD